MASLLDCRLIESRPTVMTATTFDPADIEQLVDATGAIEFTVSHFSSVIFCYGLEATRATDQ